MSSSKQVGKFYETRGDDYFVVNVAKDGSVVEIVQRDSLRLTYPSINFWATSAPKMIALIQKAAGIKVEKVEYEYAIQRTSATGDTDIIGTWWTRDDVNESLLELSNERATYTLVKRIKAGKVEKA